MTLKRLVPYLVVIFSLLILTASFSPTLYNYFRTPPQMHYTGAHNYPPDYLDYLAQTKSGLKGNLLYTSKFTTEKVSRPILSTFTYNTLGFVGNILHLKSSVFWYHFARLLFGSLYLIIIYLFIGLFFKKPLYRLGGFVLAVFSSPFPLFSQGGIAAYLRTYTFLDPLTRATFLPHHLLRNLYLYLLFYWFIKIDSYEKKKSSFFLILAGLVGLQLGMLSPPTTLLFLLTISFVFLVNLLRKKVTRKALYYFIITVFTALLGTFLLYLSLSSNPISKEIISWEGKQPPVPFSKTMLIFGPISFLAIFSLFSKKAFQGKLSLPFVFVLISITFIVTPIYRWLPFSTTRFLQTPLFPALAVLAAQGIINASDINKRKRVVSRFFTTIVIIVIGISLPYYPHAFRQQTTYHLKYPTNFYIQKAELEALNFLDHTTLPTARIMANQFNGNLIPGFTGNTVFVGHVTSTYQYRQKVNLANHFFSGKMTSKEAENLFRTHQLNYVWAGPMEQSWNINLPQTYPNLGLKEVFNNKAVIIYQANLTLD